MAKNRANNIDAAIERVQRANAKDGERYVDMAMAFVHVSEPANENEQPVETPMLTRGGRWDRLLVDYDGEAETGVVVRLHNGQRDAVDWFKAWLAEHDTRRLAPPKFTAKDLENFELDVHPSHAYSALFAGGRRAGKTWIAVACAVVYAMMYPKAHRVDRLAERSEARRGPPLSAGHDRGRVARAARPRSNTTSATARRSS
jgi:hypothetical protein